MRVLLYVSEPADWMLAFSPPREPVFVGDLVDVDDESGHREVQLDEGSMLQGVGVRRAVVSPRHVGGSYGQLTSRGYVVVHGELHLETGEVLGFIGRIQEWRAAAAR
jgi:hypothetical protein